MRLRRKSMIKSSTEKLPQDVVALSPSPLKNQNKRIKPVRYSTSDPALEGFLNAAIIEPQDPPPQNEDSALQRVEEAKQGLGQLECEIISSLFPPSGTPESFESLAIRLGMSVKEVREVADNALRGLRGTKGMRARPSSIWN